MKMSQNSTLNLVAETTEILVADKGFFWIVVGSKILDKVAPTFQEFGIWCRIRIKITWKNIENS